MPSPQVDLKIAALPPSIFDFILKKLAANIIHMFAKEAAKYEADGKVCVVAFVSHVGPNCSVLAIQLLRPSLQLCSAP